MSNLLMQEWTPTSEPTLYNLSEIVDWVRLKEQVSDADFPF